MFPPPIPVLDFFFAGVPLGPAIGLVAITAAVLLSVALKRRKVHGCLTVLLPALLFFAADCTAWVVALHNSSEARRQRRLQQTPVAPVAPASSSAAPP
jgi:hypothetical protein